MPTEKHLMKKLLLLGQPLCDREILCDQGCATAFAVAQKLQVRFRKHFGAELPITGTGTPTSRHIVIAPLPNAAYGEGLLCVRDGILYVQGNDIVGLSEAAAHLVDVLANAKADISADVLDHHATLRAREEYVNNANAFLPCYRNAYTSPVKERTLAEKRAVLKDPTGRPFVIAHRGEHIFYPENSLEGALSAWHGGADSVEVDIQKSADGIWMCMHDEDVTRTTNAAELLGKEGYPLSPLLRDWTLAQLRTLRLKDAYGVQTPFLIPTLEEILRACDGRIFVHLDKGFSVTEDIFPYLEALGIYECVYLVNHTDVRDILHLKDHFADRGIRLENLTRPRREMTLEKTLPVLLEHLPHVTPTLIPVGDYIKHGAREQALLRAYKDRIRFGAWFLRDFDSEVLWKAAREEGISIFMTDHPLDLLDAL